MKIKIERPDAEAARDIFTKYLTTTLPISPDDLAEHGGSREATIAGMIQRTVERMYTESEENRFLEVTYANGDKEVLYFKDFNSGAMLQNIVDRAKKMAIKEQLETGAGGLRVSHLMAACLDEFKENEDLPNTTNPDDWARISGKKGERIVYIRTLISGKGNESGPGDRHGHEHRPVPVGTARRRRPGHLVGAGPLALRPDGRARPGRGTSGSGCAARRGVDLSDSGAALPRTREPRAGSVASPVSGRRHAGRRAACGADHHRRDRRR